MIEPTRRSAEQKAKLMSVAGGAACLALVLLIASPLRAEEWVKKETADSWTWFEDYVVAKATYVVACEPGRDCQVGMGLFVFGQPRGEKLTFRGEREISVIGIGSLHFRYVDGKGPAKAAYYLKSASGIKVPTITW